MKIFRNALKTITSLIIITTIAFAKKDTLIAHYDDSIPELGVDIAYLTPRGDTIIPFGTYRYFDSKVITEYGIVIKPKGGIVAIDTRGEELYEVFIFDNGADYPQEGLFRILKNGLMGYADYKTGKIVIPPQYQCAYPFNGGRAKVSFKCTTIDDGEYSIWESSEWFYIDTEGKRIDQ